MTLVTATEAKAILGPEISGTGDAVLAYFLAAVDAIVEDICGPVAEATKVQTFNGGKPVVILYGPAAAVTSVVENGVTLDPATYTPNLSSGIIYAGGPQVPRVFLPGNQNVVVTYTVGSATMPGNVKLAVLEQLKALWQHSQLPNWPNINQLPDDAEWTPSGYAVPRYVYQVCAPNARRPGV